MEHTLPRKRLGFTVWISASDRHTCPTSLAARRQKRAEILRLETVPGSSKKPALMVIAMLLLQPLPVPAAPLQSLCPYSPPLTFWASLSCFTLTTPAHTHPSSLPRPVSYFLLSLRTFLISVLLPDPYGSVSSPSNFSQCFHHSLPLSLVSADGARRAGHLLRPPAFLPSLHHCQGSPSCLTAALRAGLSSVRENSGPKTITALLQFPSPESW